MQSSVYRPYLWKIREADHASENDPKDHYTVVLEDKDGNYIKTEHFDKK